MLWWLHCAALVVDVAFVSFVALVALVCLVGLGLFGCFLVGVVGLVGLVVFFVLLGWRCLLASLCLCGWFVLRLLIVLLFCCFG